MSRTNELIAAFDVVSSKYLRDEMEEAVSLQEEITPLLINILEGISADPARYVDEGHTAELYAVALLAHFRETKAHLPIIRAFSIPDEQRDYIWCDMLTETLPALLCRTAGGDYSAVMEIIRNRDAYEYLRTSAMEALKLGIASGDLPRDKGMALFATLFDESLADPEEYFWASLVMDLLDLYPEELISEIRDLFARGLVFQGEVSLKNVEDEMAEGRDKAMEKLNQLLEWSLPDDVHEYISGFACFREREEKTPVRHGSPANAQKKQKQKERSNRKKAKVSKRKNRK
ncbi:MAG TPA: DUF1186 domain-containing protein [Desulfuromonadales bacterium]|nr:DUF1186 domain-containing protein [Desulfuromonadales bacterium]